MGWCPIWFAKGTPLGVLLKRGSPWVKTISFLCIPSVCVRLWHSNLTFNRLWAHSCVLRESKIRLLIVWRSCVGALILEYWSADLELWRAEFELWWADFDIGRYYNLPTFDLRVGGLNSHFGAIICWFGAFGALWSTFGVYTRLQGLNWSFGAYWCLLEYIGAHWSLLELIGAYWLNLCSICALVLLQGTFMLWGSWGESTIWFWYCNSCTRVWNVSYALGVLKIRVWVSECTTGLIWWISMQLGLEGAEFALI
jgi:hypothetical protein